MCLGNVKQTSYIHGRKASTELESIIQRPDDNKHIDSYEYNSEYEIEYIDTAENVADEYIISENDDQNIWKNINEHENECEF